MNLTDMDINAIEEKIAEVACKIGNCKREIRVGDAARKQCVELRNQLDILVAAYAAKRSGSK